MDQKSLALLNHLRENSREKLTCISKKTSIPISTLFDTLKDLQGQVITKNTVLLNYAKLGFHTKAYVFLRVSNNDKEKLMRHFLCNANVNNVHKVNSRWNFVLETIHQNIKDLDNFLETIQSDFSIEEKQIHYLIDDIKREGFALSI